MGASFEKWRQNQGERSHQQPWRQPGDLVDQTFEELRRFGERGEDEECEQGVIPEYRIADRVYLVFAYPRQGANQPPDGKRAQQREDRLIPDRDS